MLILASAEGVAGITAGATLTAALGLALVTIYTTNRRLSEERDRHIRELDHDRELADLADLRLLLDEAAIAIDRARAARDQTEIEVHLAGVQGITKQQRRKYVEDAAKEIAQTAPPLIAMNARLRVRLGADDPITLALTDAANHLQMMVIRAFPLQWLPDKDTDEVLVTQATQDGRDFEHASQTFFAAAAGSVRLTVDPLGWFS